MKILYHHRIRSKDGQFVHLQELVSALRDLGHEVHIAGSGNIESEQFGADSVTVMWLKRWVPKVVYELLEFGYSVPDFVRLIWAIRRVRPDVIYERYNLFFVSGIWASRLLRIPLIIEVNAPLYEERSRFGGIALGGLAGWSEGIVWRSAGRVVSVTGVLADTIRARGVPPDRISVIANGINEALFASLPTAAEAKSRLGLDGKIVLGFVGFMREWHGLDRVLRFMAEGRSPRLHALFVGEGPDRQRLEAIAQDLGVTDRLTMTGLVDRGEIPSVVAAFDVALQPDVVEYASPLKLFEYMAVGLPIVAPDSPNIREVLAHEVSALLFDRTDELGLIRAVERLSFDAELRRRLGAAARQTIAERGFTWRANATRVASLATDLMGLST